MKQTSLINLSKQSFLTFWKERGAHEQAILTAAAAAIVLVLIFVMLINPSLSGRIRLNTELPVLRQQVAQLQALVKEAAALSAKPAPTVSAITGEDIEAELARKGLKAKSTTLNDDSQAQVTFSSASFAAFLSWLSEMQKNSQLSVVNANIVVLANPDRVDATVTLRQKRYE